MPWIKAGTVFMVDWFEGGLLPRVVYHHGDRRRRYEPYGQWSALFEI